MYCSKMIGSAIWLAMKKSLGILANSTLFFLKKKKNYAKQNTPLLFCKEVLRRFYEKTYLSPIKKNRRPIEILVNNGYLKQCF